MDGSSTPLLLKLNFSALNTTANTVALQFHPTILRDLTPNQAFEPDTGILHASLSDAPTITFQYWINKFNSSYVHARSTGGKLQSYLFYSFFDQSGVDTPLSWSTHPQHDLRQTHRYGYSTYHLPFFFNVNRQNLQYPPSDNHPSKAPVDSKSVIILLMHQSLQKNATLMAHLQTRPYHSLLQQTPIYPS